MPYVEIDGDRMMVLSRMVVDRDLVDAFRNSFRITFSFEEWATSKMPNEFCMIHVDNTKVWFKNGFVHRGNDLPAVLFTDGGMRWCRQGKIHRGGDKPASIMNGSKEWFLNGVNYRKGDKPSYEGNDGSKIWTNSKGRKHRLNNPAEIRSSGEKLWIVNGVLLKSHHPDINIRK